MSVERAANQVLPGPASMAGFDESCGVLLSANVHVAEGGDVRIGLADQALCEFDSCEYCRGLRPRTYPQFHSVPSDGTRLIEGIGDASIARRTIRFVRQAEYQAGNRPMRSVGKDAAVIHPIASAQRAEELITTHYSLLTTHNSHGPV